MAAAGESLSLRDYGPSHGSHSHDHFQVLVGLEGVLELEAWLRERAELRIPGDLVFPASLEGDALHKATVYRQVRATFERAGVAVPRAGGRTLRNTFAARQWQQGATADEMTAVLGLALERSAQAYRYARANPEDGAGDGTGDPNDALDDILGTGQPDKPGQPG